MERLQRGVLVYRISLSNRGCPEFRFPTLYKAIRVNCLPNGKEAIYIGMMEPKDGIKRRVINLLLSQQAVSKYKLKHY